ncbi:iron (metal) dependent repressor, DtxR family [Micrococcales bacterium KH10]|nr:iron (metal) dependent repressor, DtxR family [Micrococcales bacterium KH10]
MSVTELSTAAQNYLKVIWGLQEWSDEPITPSTIAAKTGLKLSTISGAMSKLADQGLIEHAPYGAVTLTERGRSYALTMVRRHRLIETFLVEVLGYGWDQVHDEAENLEHAVSDYMVDRIDEHLGHPTRDPHGDPIPAASGAVEVPDAMILADAPIETELVVERIADDDPDLLRFFAQQGLVVGAQLVVVPGPPYSGSFQVKVAKGEDFALGHIAGESVWVSAR